MGTAARAVERVLEVVAVSLGLATGALYVAAKLHFFRRFSGDVGAYWAEHWPYTAGLVVGTVLLWGVAWLASRIGARSSSGEGQSNNEMQRTRSAQAMEPRR